MAVPKRKPSTQRQGRRRAKQKLILPPLSHCPTCGKEKLPHFICPSCGDQPKTKENEKQKNNRSPSSAKAKSS